MNMIREMILNRIKEEREQQLKKYSINHDDEHDSGELGDAAAWYAATTSVVDGDYWPFIDQAA